MKGNFSLLCRLLQCTGFQTHDSPTQLPTKFQAALPFRSLSPLVVPFPSERPVNPAGGFRVDARGAGGGAGVPAERQRAAVGGLGAAAGGAAGHGALGEARESSQREASPYG